MIQEAIVSAFCCCDPVPENNKVKGQRLFGSQSQSFSPNHLQRLREREAGLGINYTLQDLAAVTYYLHIG